MVDFVTISHQRDQVPTASLARSIPSALCVMPLSSPAKGNRADSNARMQGQIADLTKQRDELILQYLATLGKIPTGTGVMAREELHKDRDHDAEIQSHEFPSPATMKTTKTESSDERAEATKTSPVSQTLSQTDDDMAMEHANLTLKRHIKLLHDYNEIKDIGTGIIGIIADQRGVRIADVMEEMGVREGD